MTIDRRQMMTGGVGLGAGLAGISAAARPSHADTDKSPHMASLADFGAKPNSKDDQTNLIQQALDQTAERGVVLFVPPARYRVSRLFLRSGAHLSGVAGRSTFLYTGTFTFLNARQAKSVHLEGLVLDGNRQPFNEELSDALLSANKVEHLVIEDCQFKNSKRKGLSVRRCGGRIIHNEITGTTQAGISSEDAETLEISANHIHDCTGNGIQVRRSAKGEDGTIVSGNRIENIAAIARGQFGNGLHIFRAGSVLVSNNRITDCELSAVRNNAGANCQIIGNSCTRLGGAALRAGHDFEGAVISANLIDQAATGIEVAGFGAGGRLAIVQGNMLRNLKLLDRQERHGTGISVEADSVVSGNLIEQADRIGIRIGRGKHIREVTATGNIIRKAGVGIGISADFDGGYVLVTNNMISGARDGAIRAMDEDKLLGKDLVHASAESYRNFALFGNVSTG